MTCEEFWNGEPHGLDHLGACAECAGRFERQQRLAVGLNRLGREMRHLGAPLRVERQVLAGFRAQVELTPADRPAGVWWRIAGWAAAVLVTVGIAFFLTGGRQPERTERQSRRATQLATIEAPAAIPAEEEGFIPLPNVEGIGANEAVNLVRMEIPRATLIALGVEVGGEAVDEAVEADVILGADGVARAVRVYE